ncbi:MAG: hypothetical protein GC165_02435 [Armatimonadetes bacterium]|nr:hypothetical protein [Armatimonadota bacterium]
MLTALLLAGFFQNVVSFQTPGERLELFLRDLSRVSGQDFACPVILKNEVIVAAFEDQPLETVKSQLAFVLNATWEKKGETWWLSQTDEQKKSEVRGHRELRRRNLQTLLDAVKKAAPTKEWTTADAEDFDRQKVVESERRKKGTLPKGSTFRIVNLGPQARLSMAILSQLEPSTFPLDSLGLDFNIYSVGNQPQTINLGDKFLPLLDQFKREEALSFFVQSGATFDMWDDGVFLNLTSSNQPFPRIDVALYNGKGDFQRFWTTAVLRRRTQAVGEDFQISDQTKKMVTLRKSPWQESKGPPEVEQSLKKARQVLRHAVTIDPLSLLVGPCWLDFAKSVHQPVLASLEDLGSNTTIGLYVPTLKQSEVCPGMVRCDRDGWVLGRPVDPLYNRFSRFDRSKIQVLADFEGNTSPTIEQQLDAVEVRQDFTIYGSTPLGTDLAKYDFTATTDLWSTAAFWSAWKAEVRPNPISGVLPVSSLPNDALKYLHMAYRESLLPVGDEKGYAQNWSPLFFPHGLAGMYYQAQWAKEPAFVVLDTASGQGQQMDIRAIARLVQEMLEDKSDLNVPFVKAGTWRVLHLTFFSGKGTDEQIYTDPPTIGSTEYSWKSLPQNLKNMVLEEIKRRGGGNSN